MSAHQALPRMLSTAEIVLTMKRILAKFAALHDELVRTVTPLTATFDNVIRPLAKLDNTTTGELGVILMLQYAALDLATQDAVAQARRLYIEAEPSWAGREDLYVLLQAAQRSDEDKLGPESKLLLAETLLEYRLCGCGQLDKAGMEKHIRETLELDDLRCAVQKNIVQESGGLWFSEEELHGVPPEELARWQRDDDRVGTTVENTGASPESRAQPVMKFVPLANRGTNAVLTTPATPRPARRCS